jgi:formyltetrahydrofolate synthetase
VPDVAVVVCTARALKMHSGRFSVAPGKPLDPGLHQEGLEAITAGAPNLAAHIESVGRFGVPVVVAINRFATDTSAELELIRTIALRAGACDAQIGDFWARGSAGGEDLARAVVAAADGEANATVRPRFLYPLDAPIKQKIETIALEVYGADGVEYLPRAERQIRRYTEQGLSSLPICMAKTPLSLSDDPKLKGRPTGFRIAIREVRAYTGAGFLCPIAGDIMTMPGLSSAAAVHQIDIDEHGEVVGLF